MNKEELIQIHTLMATMKEFLEKRGKGEFLKYKALNISPIHIHKSKYAHKDAIFVLGEEIISAMDDSQNISLDQIPEDKINNMIIIDDMMINKNIVTVNNNEVVGQTVNNKLLVQNTYELNRGKNG